MTKDWEPLRGEIHELYHDKNKPLAEVMRLVKGKHGFVASERSYRTQLQKWGYSKYSTQKSPRPYGKKSVLSVRRVQVVPSNMTSVTIPASLHGIPADETVFDPNGGDMLHHYGMQTNSIMPTSEPHYQDFNQGLQFDLVPPAKDLSGKTPLHHAVIDKNVEQVRTLLHAGDAVNVKDYMSNDPIHYAVMAAELALVHLLVRFGADINAKGKLGRSPLHMAVSVTTGPVVDALINAGAEVSGQDDNGDTPLHLAFTHSSYTAEVRGLIEALLQARADVNIANAAGFTPFHKVLNFNASPNYSEERFSLEMVLSFLKQGASAIKPFPDGNSPLAIYLAKSSNQWSSRSRWWEDAAKNSSIVARFLDAGASPTTPVSSGEPMAHDYFRRLHKGYRTDKRWAERLCTLANPSHLASNGNTLLHEVLASIDAGSARFTEQLLRNGANPNLQNHAGQTPMHIVFTAKSYSAKTLPRLEDVISKLLAYGADPWIQDDTGTCAHYEAVRKVSNLTMAISRLLLKADLRCRQHHEPTSETEAATTRSEGWTEWDRAIMSEDLVEGRELILRHPNSLPGDVEKPLQANAYAVLAEKFLNDARDKLTVMDDETQQRRRYIATILRDCRSHGISLDMQYYDDLLELC